MTERKEAPSVGREHFRDLLVLGLPFLLLLALAILIRETWAFIGAFVLAFPIALVGLARQERRFRRLKCPGCGALLHRPSDARGAVEFTCNACDVVWDCGFREESS